VPTIISQFNKGDPPLSANPSSNERRHEIANRAHHGNHGHSDRIGRGAREIWHFSRLRDPQFRMRHACRGFIVDERFFIQTFGPSQPVNTIWKQIRSDCMGGRSAGSPVRRYAQCDARMTCRHCCEHLMTELLDCAESEKDGSISQRSGSTTNRFCQYEEKMRGLATRRALEAL
jgi:hypothetical protein